MPTLMALPGVDGLSPSNIRYSKRFYLLYSPILENLQQAAGKLPEAPEQPKVQQAAGKLLDENLPQVVEELHAKNLPQVVEELFSVPWGHHRLIIDKCSDNPQKALFFIRSTIENGWSRSMLLNFISTDLYERQHCCPTTFQNSAS